MQPDRGTVRMDKRSGGLSTRPDDLNTLTCQSSDTNNTPRDLLLGPVTCNLAHKCTRSTYTSMSTSTVLSPPAMSRLPRAIRRCIERPPISASVIRRKPYHQHCQF